jgi:hypothetical protein
MSKPTKSTPAAESGTEAISPQQAKDLYGSHARACPRCRNLDRDRCTDGQRLWRDWEAACDKAYRQLAEDTP